MMAFLSITSVASGTLVTYLADRKAAAAAEQLELCGGLLLVIGLALLGSGLPLFRS